MKQPKSPSRRQFLAFSVAGLALATAACSKTGTTGTATAAAGTAIAGTTALFGAAGSHQLSLSWNEDDYQGMIEAYGSDSSKEWISAELTIDGVLIKNVGVRLKGNSTLRALSGGMSGAGPGNFPDGGGGTPPGGARPTELPAERPTGMGDGGMRGGPGGMGASNGISADVPQSLPLLIRFDKFVKGTKYQGLTRLALRPGSPVINEALALGLTAATGQASQRYSYVRYSVNGSVTQTRLLLEDPAEDYAETLDDGKAVLYKADSESSFSYQGAEQATYAEQFKQLNKEDSEDLSPIIDFLKWLDEADQATFEAKLADWVDIASLAKYCATQNLLANSDDMAGPGQNYYLSYNVETKRLTVISWDLNLAMTDNATASPEQSLSMGGGRGGNSLKSRFLAASGFKKLYDSAYVELYEQMYSSGKALELLEQITSSIPTSDALDQERIAGSSATVKAFVEKRTESLKTQLPAA